MENAVSNAKSKIDALFGKNDNKSSELQKKVNSYYNPFLKRNGELLNPYIDYQRVLDGSNASNRAKNYISQATGLTQTQTTENIQAAESYSPVQSSQASQAASGSYADSVGKKVANTAAYNNDAAKGQCVWYVRGRASEKLGKTLGSMGNANQMYYNAKPEAKLDATTDNIKPNMLVSYAVSGSGNKYGHVIYVEDVKGDTVYYTEGGSYYYNNGTDGVVKTATKDGILSGINTNGGRMGRNVIGFVDLEKY